MSWIILTEFVEDFVLNMSYRDLNPKIKADVAIIENYFVPNFEI